MLRTVVAVLLFALALGCGLVALRLARSRNQAIMGGLALLLVLAAAGALWWPFGGGGSPAPLGSSVRLYVGTQDSLVALQASTGSVVWTFPASGDVQAPVVVEGVAYFVVSDRAATSGTVYALNVRDGSRLWQTRLTGAMVHSTPAVGGGVVYVSSVRGVDALNARDGSLLWHAQLDSSTNPSSPTLANGMLFFGAGWAGYATYPPPPTTAACVCIYALRASDGSVVWTNAQGRVFDAPTVADGVVYDGSTSSGLFALRASDGKLLWSRPGMEGTGSPTVAQGVIYLTGFNGLISAVSARDGSLLWQAPGVGYGPPTVSDGVVYVGVTAEVVALRASDGKLLWRSQTRYDNQHLFATPVVSQGVVFVTVFCTNSFNFFNMCHNQVLALKASDGSVYWSKTLANPSDPVLDVEQISPAG